MKYISALLTIGQLCTMTKNGIQWNIGIEVEVQRQRKHQQFQLLENQQLQAQPLQAQHQVSSRYIYLIHSYKSISLPLYSIILFISYYFFYSTSANIRCNKEYSKMFENCQFYDSWVGLGWNECNVPCTWIISNELMIGQRSSKLLKKGLNFVPSGGPNIQISYNTCM